MQSNPKDGEVNEESAALLCCPFRKLHNQCIKHPDQGGFPGACDWSDPNNPKVLLSDTMLRALAPRNLVKMTDSQKMLCGCETCIMAKELLFVLNYWNTLAFKSMENKAKKLSGTEKRKALSDAEKFKMEQPNTSIPES